MTAARKALRLVGREKRLRWLLLIVLALVASGFEIMGAGLVYVLLALVASPEASIEIPLVGDPRAVFRGVGDETLLLGLVAGMAIFFVLRAIVHVGQSYIQSRVAHNAGAQLATKLMTGYLSLPYSYHLRHNSSELIRNGHQAVDELVGHVFLPLIRVSAEIIMVTSMLVILAVIAPGATAIAVLVVGSAALLLLVVIQPRLKRLGRRAHQLRRDTLQIFQQSLHGIRDIKILSLEKHFSHKYGQGRRRLARSTYLRSTATELPRSVIETALLGFILLFFAITVIQGTAAQETLSILGLFAYAGLRLQPSLHRIIAGLNNLKFSTAPLDALHRDLVLIESQPEATEVVAPIAFEHSLELRDVTVSYEGSDRPALRSVRFAFKPGEVIGICGPTGGGKTTLVDIITGLLEPTAGVVLVDGRDLQDNVKAWQQSLGVVPQMVFLTDDSLRRNIALGIPDSEIDEMALDSAIELAQLDEFIEELPEGLETEVGERGVRVSGGQRQRVAIARALYRQPMVVIFDEGTSALDNATEAEVMSALENLRGDRTVIMVAHRLSTVKNCDHVIFLEEGRVAGIDTFEGLRATNEAFRRMAKAG